MIDEKKLIKDVRACADLKHYNGEIEIANGILKSLSIIKNQPQASQWIKCSDRLPEPRSKSFGDKQQREDVLACQRNGMVKEMLFEFSTQEFWEAGDTNPISHWQENDNGYDAEVIAWQPLPSPYKEG